MKKKFIVFIILLFMFTTITIPKINVVKAAGAYDIFQQGKNFISLGSSTDPSSNLNVENQWDDFNDVLGIVWTIGLFVMIISGVVLGIKYMFSSLEERAQMKQNLFPFSIGGIIIFGALSILKIVIDFIEVI